MTELSTIGLDLAKNVFSSTRSELCRSGHLP